MKIIFIILCSFLGLYAQKNIKITYDSIIYYGMSTEGLVSEKQYLAPYSIQSLIKEYKNSPSQIKYTDSSQILEISQNIKKIEKSNCFKFKVKDSVFNFPAGFVFFNNGKIVDSVKFSSTFNVIFGNTEHQLNDTSIYKYVKKTFDEIEKIAKHYQKFKILKLNKTILFSKIYISNFKSKPLKIKKNEIIVYSEAYNQNFQYLTENIIHPSEKRRLDFYLRLFNLSCLKKYSFDKKTKILLIIPDELYKYILTNESIDFRKKLSKILINKNLGNKIYFVLKSEFIANFNFN